ncbi:hypothetical protein GX586_01735 [bacterium]|nr:hypothetical protein [bacterium]
MLTGVAWYRREQWELLRYVSSDADKLEDTYDEWLESAERTFKEILKAGINLVKVDVDVDELVAWCRSQGRPVDGDARSLFVTHKIRLGNRGADQQRPGRE